MNKPITYECRKCGKRYVASGTGEKKQVPLYCCGTEVKAGKERTAKRKTAARKKTSKKK